MAPRKGKLTLEIRKCYVSCSRMSYSRTTEARATTIVIIVAVGAALLVYFGKIRKTNEKAEE